jgi:hypothetical protein
MNMDRNAGVAFPCERNSRQPARRVSLPRAGGITACASSGGHPTLSFASQVVPGAELILDVDADDLVEVRLSREAEGTG